MIYLLDCLCSRDLSRTKPPRNAISITQKWAEQLDCVFSIESAASNRVRGQRSAIPADIMNARNRQIATSKQGSSIWQKSHINLADRTEQIRHTHLLVYFVISRWVLSIKHFTTDYFLCMRIAASTIKNRRLLLLATSMRSVCLSCGLRYRNFWSFQMKPLNYVG